jgi:predicted phage tail protein
MIDNYVVQDRFRYVDALKPEDFSQHPSRIAIYAVRTRTSQKKESAPSNIAALRIYPLPDPIDDLKAEVTHSGIQLTETPPTKTLVGPAPPIFSYRIFRAESQSTATTQAPSARPAAAQTTQATPGAPMIKIAETQSPNYLDAQIQFGNTYTYSVRTVAQLDGHELESADSNRITILARDTFPPAAPQRLVVVFVPSQAGEPAHLELSWAISPETDLAGYNVYQSDQVGVQGTRLNTELLPTPAFQDMNAVPGRTYLYSVTAVDRSGNESPASAAVPGTVPAESQSTP